MTESRARKRLEAALATLLLSFVCARAEIITGTAVMKLTSPATAEVRAQAMNLAADSLSDAISEWMRNTGLPIPDLGNPVKKHFFGEFTKACLKRAKQDSYFEGHEWMLNLDIRDEDAKQVMAVYNASCDSSALANYREAAEAAAAKQYSRLYRSSVRALFYALGAVGRPADEDSVETLARAALGDVLARLSITYDKPIIKGKPGRKVTAPIVVKAAAGEAPFEGLVLLARLPDGTKVATLTTDAQGFASLDTFTMPFVAYGTFLHVVPDLGAMVGGGYSFEASAFGVRLTESQDQTLIFDVVKPVYTLTYQAVAANKVDVPADFSSDVWLRKFLQDSCSMLPLSPGRKDADIVVDIRCQVSSYTFDEREETEMKVEARASIRQSDGIAAEKTAELNKHTYDSNHPIPAGQFFWETTTNLKGLIKQMLAGFQ
jgi:hypothetical protein